MISLKNNTAGLDNETINGWVVLFNTPFGLFRTSQEAVRAVEEAGANPALCIVPVAAAFTNNSYEVVQK